MTNYVCCGILPSIRILKRTTHDESNQIFPTVLNLNVICIPCGAIEKVSAVGATVFLVLPNQYLVNPINVHWLQYECS